MVDAAAARVPAADLLTSLPTAIVRLALLAIAILLYAHTFGYPLTGIDDVQYYLQNPSLQAGRPAGLATLWSAVFLSDWAPVSLLTQWLDLASGALDHPWIARLHSALWFAVGILGVHAMLLRLTSRPGLALAIALLVAVHPVCVQSVVWLAERKNLVAFALAIWSLERYIAVRRGEAAWGGAAVCALLGIAALAAKSHAVALPALLVPFEIALGRGRPWQRALAVLPAVAVTATYIAITLVMVRQDLVRPMLGGSLASALGCDGWILLRYLSAAVLPTNLAFYYAVDEHAAPAWQLFGAALCVAIAGLGVLLAQDGQRRLAAFSWLAIVAALSPALNLAPQLAPLADQYLLWALPFLLLAIALALDGLLVRWTSFPAARVPLAVGGGALALILLTVAQSSSFASKQRLFLVATRHQPGCGQNWAHRCLDSITTRSDPLDPRPGDYALTALTAVDGHRIIDIVRAPLVVEACAALRRQQRTAEAEALMREQLPLLPDIGFFRPLTRALVEIRLGKGSAALGFIGDLVPDEVGRTAAEFAGLCRDGQPLPDQLPPARTFASAALEQFDGERWRQRWTLLLWAKASACFLERRDHEALGMAALAVNISPDDPDARQLLAAVYEEGGKQDAARRLRARQYGSDPVPGAPAPHAP